MKAILLILFAALLFSSCSKKKSTTPDTVTDTDSIPIGTISAKVDGIPTTFENNAYLDTATLPFDFMYNSFNINIIGFQDQVGSSQNINIWLTQVPAGQIRAGSYPNTFIDTTVIAGMYYDTTGYANPNKGFICTTPVMKIISIDSTIKGTFSGELVLIQGQSVPNTHIMTDGKFNVRIQ